MKFIKQFAAVVFVCLFAAGGALAQGQQMQKAQPDSITDQDLKKFANVTKEVQKIQMESRQKVQNMLDEKDMDMRRFQKIMMSKNNPQMADSVEVTPKEEKTIKELQPKLMKMQQDGRQKMMTAMQDNNLKPQRFQNIMRAIQSDPAVMKRFQKIAKDTLQQ